MGNGVVNSCDLFLSWGGIVDEKEIPRDLHFCCFTVMVAE